MLQHGCGLMVLDRCLEYRLLHNRSGASSDDTSTSSSFTNRRRPLHILDCYDLRDRHRSDHLHLQLMG